MNSKSRLHSKLSYWRISIYFLFVSGCCESRKPFHLHHTNIFHAFVQDNLMQFFSSVTVVSKIGKNTMQRRGFAYNLNHFVLT